MSVQARPDVLYVRNYFKTYRVPWSDVEAFGKSHGLFTLATEEVRLSSGKRIRLKGVVPGLGGARGPLRNGVEQLEAYRAAVASQTTATKP